MAAGLRFDQVGGLRCMQVTVRYRKSCSIFMVQDQRCGSRRRCGKKTLTDAANKKQRVHVSGKWDVAANRSGSYVEVTRRR